MDIPAAIADQINEALNAAHNILLISHRNPDPDTIGTSAALRRVLEQRGKKVTSYCVDQLPVTARFLPVFEEFVTHASPDDFDTFVSVDAGSTSQAAYPLLYPEVLDGSKTFINIDHHPSNAMYGTINLVISDAASTTAIMYNLLNHWGERITPEISTCLLYGLYFDTGSFMHSNTNEEVYDLAAKLLLHGADRELIIKNLFKSHTVEQLKLWGKVLSGVELTDKNVVVSAVTKNDISECNANREDLSGVIDYLSSVPESQFATLLCEDPGGEVRGSLRTRRENVNVSEIAKSLGGGGHTKASGFAIQGELKKEERWTISEL